MKGKYIPKFKIQYTKCTGRFTAAKTKKEKSYVYMKKIAQNSYFRAVDRERQSAEERISRKRKLFIRPKERPDRDEIIKDSIKYSRLK